MARLERGEDLVASVEALAREQKVRSAWVRGHGLLEWVELGRHDQGRLAPERSERFLSPCELLGMEGTLSALGGAYRARLHGTLSRRTDNGVQVLGGEIRAGRVFDVEVMLEVLEDVRLERVEDEDAGLALWRGAPIAGVAAAGAAGRPRPGGGCDSGAVGRGCR